jgi:hypothetical protein
VEDQGLPTGVQKQSREEMETASLWWTWLGPGALESTRGALYLSTHFSNSQVLVSTYGPRYRYWGDQDAWDQPAAFEQKVEPRTGGRSENPCSVESKSTKAALGPTSVLMCEQFCVQFLLIPAPCPQVHVLKFQPLGPQEMTVFGNGSFKEVLKFKWHHWGIP